MNRILVVDDDLDILTAVELILSKNNYEVKTVSRWQIVFDSILEFEPDIIILDISLGGADGREICRELKSNENTRHISIILFSAYHNFVEQLHDCKADNVIAKPFEVTDILEIIKKTLTRLQ